MLIPRISRKLVQLGIYLILILAMTSIAAAADAQLAFETDYADADFAWAYNKPESSKYIFIRKIFSRTVAYFESVFKVTSANQITVNPSFVPQTGRFIRNKKIPSSKNFYLYVDAYYAEQESITTQGSIIQKDPNTGRPVAGIFLINLALVNGIDNPSLFSYQYMPVMAFDVFKMLGFDRSLFSSYIDLSTGLKLAAASVLANETTFDTLKGDYFTLTQSSSFVKLTSDSFRATSPLSGVLSQSGIDDYYNRNSLLKSLYVNDFLNPTEEYPCLLSQSSISWLAGTGWYTFSTVGSSAWFQPVYYGKIITSSALLKNDNFQKDGLCLSTSVMGGCLLDSEVGCSEDGTFKTICKTDGSCKYKSGTKYCQVNDNSKDYLFEYYGPGSRCVMVAPNVGDTPVPACMKVTSAGPGNRQITVSNLEGTASAACAGIADQNLVSSGQTMKVMCSLLPDTPLLAAAFNNKCTNDCSGNGFCLTSGETTLSAPAAKQCFCHFGFTGDNCQTDNQVQAARDLSLIMQSNAVILSRGQILLTAVACFFGMANLALPFSL
jgi:hypothetical protein